MYTHIYIYIYRVYEKIISFHKLIPKRISVQISSHFDSMILNRSKFDVFIFTDIKMKFTGRENVFCVLKYARSQSNRTVQHAFVRELSIQLPTAMQIWTWHINFKEKVGYCRRKGSGRPKTSEETVERVCKKILQSPKKSLQGRSLETQIPPTTVWRILRKRLIMKNYKLQLFQAITAEDKQKRKPN